MADLALVSASQLEIDATKLIVQAQLTLPAGVAIVRGQAISFNTTTGLWQLADADVELTAGQVYIALRTVNAKDSLTGSQYAVVSGFNLSQALGAIIYLSNTAGAFGDAAGTTSIPVGRVVPVFGAGAVTPDKAVRFNMLNAI